jgi:Tfp pilus assembly major pilin PilA
MQGKLLTAADIARRKAQPIAFISEVLRDPETGRPFTLYQAQIEFIRRACTPQADGSLPFAELLYSCPKNSGKTATAAMIVIYVIVVLSGPYAEGYCVANDFEQAASRVFQACTPIIEASPLLRNGVKITANKVEFVSTGSTITAIASDYAGAAGSNPTISVFDELWAFTSERAHRLWDQSVPVPTRKVSVRLTVTYAGFSGESKLLEELYTRGLKRAEVVRSSLCTARLAYVLVAFAGGAVAVGEVERAGNAPLAAAECVYPND